MTLRKFLRPTLLEPSIRIPRSTRDLQTKSENMAGKRKSDVTRDNLQQQFFEQHRVNFSCYVKRVNFRAASYKKYLVTYMLHKTIFSATPTRNILRARPGHVEQNSGKVLPEKSTAVLLHEPTF